MAGNATARAELSSIPQLTGITLQTGFRRGLVAPATHIAGASSRVRICSARR